jgi:hypothetical protein
MDAMSYGSLPTLPRRGIIHQPNETKHKQHQGSKQASSTGSSSRQEARTLSTPTVENDPSFRYNLAHLFFTTILDPLGARILPRKSSSASAFERTKDHEPTNKRSSPYHRLEKRHTPIRVGLRSSIPPFSANEPHSCASRRASNVCTHASHKTTSHIFFTSVSLDASHVFRRSCGKSGLWAVGSLFFFGSTAQHHLRGTHG